MNAPIQSSSFGKTAVLATGIWIVIEVIAQVGGALLFEPIVGNLFVGSLVGVVVGFPVAAWSVTRFSQRRGIALDILEFGREPSRLVFGFLAGGALVIVNLTVIATASTAIFGPPAEIESLILEGFRGGMPVVLLFIVAHGLVAPFFEEFVFRGLIQTPLTKEYGTYTGIFGAAMLFSFKHIVVDGSFVRILPIVVLALVLGVVREKWGLTGSTVAHGVVNFIQGNLTVLAFL